MFRKYNIVALLAALGILLGIYFLVDFTGNEDQPLRSKILSIDPVSITSLKVTDNQTGDHVEIINEGAKCRLLSNGREYSGAPEAVGNALVMLNQLPTESVVATTESKWAEFKVDEKQAINIQLFVGGKQVEELYVGKFEFKKIPADPGKQPQTRMTTYVRMLGDDNVYAVNGLLRSNFQGGIIPFRNRTVFFCKQPEKDITHLSIQGPDQEVSLDLSGEDWLVNGMRADSAKTDKYLRGLSRMRSSTFIDDVDVSQMLPAYSIKIEGSSFDPVLINAYPADSIVQYYITSSMNAGSVMDGSKGKIIEKAFVGPDTFLPDVN